jgi:hypothetical protein
MNIPIYIVNHILSFRPTHPVANLIKNPCAKTCLEISDFWKNKSGFSYNISIELMRLDNFDNFKKQLHEIINNDDNTIILPKNKYSNVIDIDNIIKNFGIDFYNVWDFIENSRNYSEEMYTIWEEKYNKLPRHNRYNAFLEKYQPIIC